MSSSEISLPESSFDPSLTGSAEDGIYGIATARDKSVLVYIPVPWEVTTSYGSGTAQGPAAILRASPQLDLFLRGVANHYEGGFHLLPESEEIVALNREFKPVAQTIQAELEQSGSLANRPDLQTLQNDVNAASVRLNDWVYEQAARLDAEGKKLALIGGDHSSPLGLIKYLCEKYQGDVGVLHVDAHHDLRDAYQGFVYSHASIMKNVLDLQVPPVSLVQGAIRDFSEDEAGMALAHPGITTFYDEDIKGQLFEGACYADIVAGVLAKLPQQVYVSFDIDGLQPDLCPGTGTPVAGGLTLEQAQYLIKALVRSGRKIVGFDLSEVAPNSRLVDDEWDGNVGARVLYMLSSWMMESHANASNA